MRVQNARPLLFLGTILGLNLACKGITEAQEPASGTLVVVNKGSNNTSVIDVASGLIVATVPVGRSPHADLLKK